MMETVFSRDYQSKPFWWERPQGLGQFGYDVRDFYFPNNTRSKNFKSIY